MIKYKYKWNKKENPVVSDELIGEMSYKLDITEVTSKLLVNRGCDTVEAARAFLAKEDGILHDPFEMDSMDKAAERIAEAIASGEKIIVYGDYDVDGVTSVCALLTYLRNSGADAEYYIPSRAGEGYGVSEESVRKFAADGVGLIITVDTGITAVKEAELCRELGVTFIVTDHHECHDMIPDAYAVVNPKKPGCPYKFKELAGVGVVFKLLCAVETVRTGDNLYDCSVRISNEYIDFAAIGTIADVMPLIDENRLIVAEGLIRISETEREGLKALMNAVSVESKKRYETVNVTSGYISFSIAPRINAAGRIDNAGLAVELLIAEDHGRAYTLAKKLCDINKERQQAENEIAASARAKIEADESIAKAPVIVIDDEKWHHGIIGIVSSRITERYGKPSVLVSFEGASGDGSSPEDVGKGSGRSVRGMNLVDALKECGDLLEKFGGHELAAGLSVKRKNLPELRRRLSSIADRVFKGEDISPGFDYDMELFPENISLSQAEELYILEPYGVSNPQPLFVLRGVIIDSYCTVGSGKHTKFTIICGNMPVTVMCFRHVPEDFDVYPGDIVDVLFNLDVNEFQNHKTLQLIAKDLRLTESIYSKELSERDRFASIYSELTGAISEGRSAELQLSPDIVPSRDDFVYVYTLLKRELKLGHEVYSMRALLNLIGNTGGNIGYIKLRFVIMILNELSLISADETDTEAEKIYFRYIDVKGRTNLENSPLYRMMLSCIE